MHWWALLLLLVLMFALNLSQPLFADPTLNVALATLIA